MKLSEEINKKIEDNGSNEKTEEIFPEHEFISSCLRIGLTLNDLKEITYIDAMKLLFSYIDFSSIEKNNTENIREATQADIDSLLG